MLALPSTNPQATSSKPIKAQTITLDPTSNASKVTKRNQEISMPDTEFKVALMIEYQDYCDPAKRQRFERRIDPLTDATKKEKATQETAKNSRDKAYLQQITEALKKLKPGAKLYYTLGENYFDRLNNSLNEIDTLFVNINHPKQ